MGRLQGFVESWGVRRVAGVAILAAAMLWLLYSSGLLAFWMQSEEYGHGPLVLLVLAYLIYCRRDNLTTAGPPSVALVALAAMLPLLVLMIGALSGISQLEMYSVWLFGVVLTFAIGGFRLLWQLLIPLLIAFMVIPLPNGIEVAVTSQLQLISSELGVWFIRLFGGVVHLQGNLIDMGQTQLLVAEACAGLRYLYPLMSLGAIAGYLLVAPLWIRWTLFLASIPITIFMNSFRIGVTGLLVEFWGAEPSEGFLHFFEGWVVFIFALLLLLMLAWLLVKLQPGAKGLIESLSFEGSGRHGVEKPAEAHRGRIAGAQQRSFVVLAAIMVVAAALSAILAGRSEIVPERQPLSEFPLTIGDWSSREYRLPQLIEQVAGASEYFYADFYSSAKGDLNLYVSYYETQRQGQIPHSPRVCIPGDGWQIVSVEPVSIATNNGIPLQANRLVTRKGNQTMLAYYWLKQGERTYRQELLARLDLIRSAAFHRRTDGALIRLVSEVHPDEDMAEVDRRLQSFAGTLVDVLPIYVPD
ncbi:hypothetical protein CAI21_09725 [Alkalilimnicola ehrlichii]|uniref:Methanolan biosynthesis EpsI domain-containing protein n=1 Tax=Alkalilimnicola ehrlichii TaxID=351052 RepID=A0A3E0WXY6_9GAMM|nr:VPLPA-CTERM-specific exosortase XrtD [Alkalilimnicola ehrlichii]RFA29340.1 hypothetical protein CAI21_09725 [Alkalilimnicola ehrlichii]RFA36855.1 hypothetical protein CAL65_10060 [Alkalilimnicola ehrlichii]